MSKLEERYEQWKKNRGTQVQSSSVKQPTIEDRYNSWKARTGYVSPSQTDLSKERSGISDRVQSWLKQNDQITADYNGRYGNREQNQYIADSEDWMSQLSARKKALDQEKRDIYRLISGYNDDWANTIREALDNGTKNQLSILDTAEKDAEYWSQWVDENAYRENEERVLRHNKLMGYDTAAGAKEIQNMDNALEQYSQIMNQLNSGGRGYYTGEYAQIYDQKMSDAKAKADELINNYGDMEVLEGTLAEKRKSQKEAEDYQRMIKNMFISDPDSEYYAPDFDKYSQYVPNKNGTYEYINNPEARKRYQQSAAMTGNSALNPFADKNYELMRDDEIATYNYYYAKEGPEAAQKYLDSIQESLNYRSGAIEYAGLEDSVPLELLYGIKAGEDQFQSGMESLFNSKGKSKAASDTQIVSSMIREDLGEGSLGQVAYDVINNTSNMLPSIFVGMLNPIAGTVTMGASAAGSGYQEMIDLGYSQEQAASYGALVGASESLLQYALGGISKLGGKLTGGAVTKLLNNVDNALARVAIKLGGNMLSEASEESLQEILSPWFESIITGTEYDVDMGDVFYSGLLGALTAGLLESGSTVSGEVELAKQGAKLQQTEGAVESLVNIGKATPVESVAYRLANKVDENTGAYTVGRLFNELGATLSQQNIADITKSLVRKGVAESDATTIAEYFKNVVNGYAFTQQQAKLIEANEDLARTVYDVIINPKSTVNQRMDGYRSIAEKINNPAEIVQSQNATSDVYDAEALERIASAYGKHAEAMKRTYNPGQNVDLYAKSYDLMYNYGKEGVKREYALNQKAADYLTPEQREIAYDTGATLAKKPAVDAQDSDLNVSNSEVEESYTEPVGESLNESSATIYDGDAVSVASIKSINNGVVTFALEDGRSATADQLSFGNEADSVLYSGIAQIAPDATVANDLIRAYQNGPKMDVSTYLQGVKEAAENYGANNIPMNEMETTGFAADLTPAQRRIAYKAGQKLAGMSVARAQSRVSSGTKASRTGKVHYETSVDTSKLNAQQKAGVAAIERLAEALGIDFYLYESKVENGRRVGANGYYNIADGSIHVDLYAGANGEGTMLFTVAHELTHFIKQWSPAKFKVLANFLMQEYGKSNQSVSDLVRAQINKAKANNRTLSYEEAYEEMVADSMEIMLADGNVVEKLARLKQQDRTLWHKIKDFISDLAMKIRSAYKGLKPDSAEGKLVAEMKNAVDRLQELFTEAVVDASENYAAFEDMSNEEAFEDSSVAIHYQIRPPYTDGSRAFNEFTDSLSPEARKTFDLFYGFYQNSRITNTTSVSGKRVKAVNISALYLLADDWNAMLQKEPKWAEAAQKLADFLPKNVRERMNMNEDGTLNPTMLEKEFKMPSSMAQRLVDALPVENIDAEYTLGNKEITLPEGKARQSVGGEAYRRAIIAETRKLFAEGKLKQVGIGTMSKDRWGSLGFLAANGKTGASGDFTTVCPQMMFNRGCWYCYRRAAMEKGVNNKLVAQSVWYTGEILRIKDGDIQSLNRNGGLRIQSFGDWMPHFSAMLADVLYDAEQRGLQVKIITKEPSMINYIAALRSQGVGKNLYFNLSADYTIEKGPAKPATDSNSLDAVNPERPFTRIDNSFWWKRAMTVEEAAKYRAKYPWVNTRIVATTQEEFIRGLKDNKVDVVTGYHGNIREFERVDSTTGEHKVQVEALGDAGMPRFAYNPGTNEWVTEYEGKTSTHKALAKAIADNGLQYEYYIKTCCITGRCATCEGKCGALAKDFNIKNATNRDAESVAYWQKEMQYGIEPEFGEMTVKYSERDSEGNHLSAEQQEFFANSKVRLDEDGDYWYGEGALAPVYHATEAQFTTFKKKYFGQETYATIPEYQATAHLGFWFNTQDPMNSVLKGSKYVVKAYLNIRNPYDANTLDGLATEISILSQNSESPSSMGKAFVRYLKNKGYDGIVIRDEEIGGVSFVAFESNQIKDVTNKAPTPKKDIRFSDRPASILDDEAALHRLIDLQNKQQEDGAKITTTSVDAVSRKIMRQVGIEEGDWKELSKSLKDLYEYLKHSPDFTRSDIEEHARPAIEWLQENTESQYNAWDLMKKIYDGYWDVSTLYPVADAFQKDINRLKTERKDKRKEAVDKYKEKAGQREGREKLQKLVLETMKWISSPAKDAPRVPDILKKPYADFLTSIDMSSKRLLAGGDPTKNDLRIASAADTLQKTLANIALGQDPDSGKNSAANQFIDLSEDLVNRFSEFAETVKAMSDGNIFVMQYMSAEQLLQLRKDIRSLNHAIREIDTLNSTDLFANARDLGESSMQSMDELGELKSNIKLKDTAMWDNGLPYYVFKRFGKAGEAIFEGLMNGQDKLAVLAQELFTFQQKTWKETEAKQWSEDYHDITLPSGNTIRLTTADAMSIYCLSRRPQGLQHLLGGGIRIIGQKKAGRKASDSVTLLTLNDIDAITSSLTSKQKSVAEKMQEYMSTTCAEWGNEISMKRFLTKDFNEKYYFPIESDPENRSVKDPGIEQSDLFRLLNISATKALDKNANNRVIIRNVFDVFVNHASDMARLNAYALPLLDYMKWINYRQRSVSDIGQVSTAGVRQSMRRAFGDAAERYVITLIKDVNGKPYDGGDPTILRKMMKAAKTASVGFSLKTSMLQVTSYPRAALVLSTKSLVLGLRKLPNLNRAKKYCPIALWKSFGFYDTNIARSMEEQLKGTTNIKQKLIKWSLKGAELGDGLVWGCLWNACEYEVAATKQYKVGTEEFYQAVGRKLREVIYSTQVVDSVLTRSQLMRKKGGMAQEATAFMSEPTLSANILMDAESRFELEVRRSNKRTAWKMHGGHIIRTLGVTTVVGIMTALPEAFWAALRDDDDEKEFAEKFAKEFKESVVLNLLPFNKLPIVSDFAEALLSLMGVGYFSTDKLASTALSRTVSAVKAWDQVLGGDSSTTAYNAMYKTAQAGSTWAGLGFSNLIRDIVTVWNNTAGAADPTMKIRMYEPGRNAWGKMLYRAYVNGDTEEAKKIEQKFESENDRKTGLRAAIKAKYEDGTIDSTTAIDHLMEYADMDEDEAYWKIQEWDGGDDYTKYAEWIDAVRSGKDLSAVIKKYTDNGVETGTLKSQITAQLKNEYVTGSASAKRELQKLIINAYKALGEEAEDAQEAMGAWQYAADYPEYSERVTYNQYQQWVEYGKGKNVTLNTFADVLDYRRNGGDSRSQEEVAKYIDGLSLTKTQKDALWCCLWSEKTLKNAPWN